MDPRRQPALRESLAELVVAGGATAARRVDSARAAREPGIQHDALSGRDGSHRRAYGFDDACGFVAEDLRKRDDGCERVVAITAQERLLCVAAADAREPCADEHPIIGGECRLGRILEPARRPGAEVAAGGDAASDLAERELGQAVAKDECVHGGSVVCRS